MQAITKIMKDLGDLINRSLDIIKSREIEMMNQGLIISYILIIYYNAIVYIDALQLIVINDNMMYS
jgi:hypothetical protein